MVLEMLNERAAGTVYDALGHTGGPGGIQDEQRVIEGQLLERNVRGCVPRGECLQTDGLRHPHGAGPRVGVRNDDHVLHVRKLLQDFRHVPQGVVFPPLVEITIGGEQYFRCDLTEAMHHTTHTEVRGAG